MKFLITGCAGFIGFSLARELLKNKDNNIVGVDAISDYYPISLKKKRLSILKKKNNFKFFKKDLSKMNNVKSIFAKCKFDTIIHLAAQPGVRRSIKFPQEYYDANISSFFNILECARKIKLNKIIFASSSSVYGDNKKFPLKETNNTDNPLSFYGATKKINEVIASSYANIYKTNSTALRFFTVYGPFGRPDMALFKFTHNILNKKTSDLYNGGEHVRDFTYVDDVVESLIRLLNSNKKSYFEIFNIAGGKPVTLNKYIKEIEKNLNIKGKFKKLKLQLGDVKKTHASSYKLNKRIGYIPKTRVSTGVKKFVSWYVNLYKK